MTDQRTRSGLARGFVQPRRGVTLVQHFGDFLAQAEALFGPRDRDFTPLGIEFGPEGPITQFPAPHDRRHVGIVLSLEAAQDENRAAYELAGLVVFLLAPGAGLPAVVIEYGAAAFFQMTQARRLGFTPRPTGPHHAAGVIVAAVLESDIGAIRRAREIEPTFTAMTPALLVSVGICPALAPRLTARFSTLTT